MATKVLGLLAALGLFVAWQWRDLAQAGKRTALAGKVVLVTGAASGIGEAGARALQRAGALPVLVDCDAAPLAALAKALDAEAAGAVRQAGLAAGDVASTAADLPVTPGVLCVVADVTNAAQCADAVAAAVARHGRLDVVWANAGVASFGPLAYTDPLAWERCIQVNVLGVFHTVRAALPELMRQRGQVLVSASVSSFAHPPMMSAYAASKAAVEAMCNAWRIELAAHGVSVSALHASWVRTPLMEEGALHPAFGRLRATMPGLLNGEVSAEAAAHTILQGLAQRRSRIWVPGWVRWLHVFRAVLHTQAAERALRQAAPELERLYLEGLAESGPAASSFGPRELARSQHRPAG
jgi:NAD(P)-dependent dehydrogenase (short-subunit alcohol dehydrogenase family)